jgi:hypothetical protein
MELPRTVEVNERYQAPQEELYACGRCSSQLVEPVAVRRFDSHWWHVERRCPECRWTGADLVTEDAVAHLEEQLHAARAAMTALLDTMQRSEMERDVERFAHALALDQVLPEDF